MKKFTGRISYAPSMSQLPRASSMHALAAQGGSVKKVTISKRKSTKEIITSPTVSLLQDCLPSYGLFEASQIACPVLPQYHPQQLMELLNSGKILLSLLRLYYFVFTFPFPKEKSAGWKPFLHIWCAAFPEIVERTVTMKTIPFQITKYLSIGLELVLFLLAVPKLRCLMLGRPLSVRPCRKKLLSTTLKSVLFRHFRCGFFWQRTSDHQTWLTALLRLPILCFIPLWRLTYAITIDCASSYLIKCNLISIP